MSLSTLGKRYERLLLFAAPISLASIVTLFVVFATNAQEERARARCYDSAAAFLETKSQALEAEWKKLSDTKSGRPERGIAEIKYVYAVRRLLIDVQLGSTCYKSLLDESDNRYRDEPKVIVSKLRDESKQLLAAPIKYAGVDVPAKANISLGNAEQVTPMISANQLHSEARLLGAEAREFNAKRPDSRGFLPRCVPFCALLTHLSRQDNPRVSHVVECTHRDQAIGVLGQSPVAGLGVAPQPLDVQKRMFNPGTHCALAPVLRFLRVRQRCVSLRSLVGEVLRIRRGLFDRCFLPPVRTVAVDPRLRTVQEIGQDLAIVHIGADTKSGLIHSATTTAATVHDSQRFTELLHGAETRVYGDSAYRGQKDAIKQAAPNAKDFTNERAQRNAPLTDAQKAKNRSKSAVRAHVEHPFLHIKRLWGYAKTRYRGLAKNANRLIAMCALYNVRHAGIILAG